MSETIKLTLGQAIVKFLDNVYYNDGEVEHKYVHGFATIFGHGNVLGLGEALANYEGDFKFYQGKNEQGMAHMAIGFAKQNNRQKIIACTTSIGPGSANLVTAAGTATVNNIPLLLFPGDTFASRRPDPVLQQLENSQSPLVTTNDALKPVSVYFDRITRPEQIIHSIQNAIEVLINPATTGAVTIALSQDVQGESYDYPVHFFDKKVYNLPRYQANQLEIHEAVKVLSSAKKPIAIIGGGARYSLARNEITKFLEKYHIPFVSTQAGKGTIKSSNPLNLGGVGVTGNLSANTYIQDCDVVLAFGTRYSDFTTGSKTILGGNAKHINFNIRSFDLMKLNASQVRDDIKTNVKLFDKEFRKANKDFSAQSKNIIKAKKLWSEELKRLGNITTKDSYLSPEINDANQDSAKLFLNEIEVRYGGEVEPLSQTRALYLLRQYLPADASIWAAAGSLPGDLQRVWETDVFATYNLEYGYSCMGHEIAAAIGASVALKRKPTYAFLGDGSFLMLHTEIHTALQEGIPVVIFLFDNSGFGCINNLQVGNKVNSFETEFKYRSKDGMHSTGQFIMTDYSMIAKGYGADSYLIKNEKELIDLLPKLSKVKKTTLVELKVLPKSMTHDYSSNWEVGLAEVSKSSEIVKRSQHLKNIFKNYGK